MPATLARSAAPPYALRVWITDTAVFTEIPGKGEGMPHVMSFPLHEAGLSKALNLLRERKTIYHGRSDVSGEPWIAPAVIASNARASQGSETQRAHAQAVLRRMGII